MMMFDDRCDQVFPLPLFFFEVNEIKSELYRFLMGSTNALVEKETKVSGDKYSVSCYHPQGSTYTTNIFLENQSFTHS